MSEILVTINNESNISKPFYSKGDCFERMDDICRIDTIEYIHNKGQYFYSGVRERWNIDNGFSNLRPWIVSEKQLRESNLYRPLTTEEIDYLESVELKLIDRELGIKQFNKV